MHQNLFILHVTAKMFPSLSVYGWIMLHCTTNTYTYIQWGVVFLRLKTFQIGTKNDTILFKCAQWHCETCTRNGNFSRHTIFLYLTIYIVFRAVIVRKLVLSFWLKTATFKYILFSVFFSVEWITQKWWV